MATELDKLKRVLAELFDLDAAEDLDFGMYRVLRLRRAELRAFLEDTLVAEVGAALGPGEDGPQRQVYAHLTAFFARYYEEGDFVSLPRLRRAEDGRDTYAIPYDGADVVLHWANKDQHYVKSGEHFARYAFALGDDRRVVFRLVDAETDPNDVKAADAGKRRFRLAEGDAVTEEEGALVCRFVYAVDDARQPAVNAATEARILAAAPEAWRVALTTLTGGETALARHLRQYTERNRRDYFIHTDLAGFLGRELDQYLKTEVFDLDAVDTMGPDDVARTVALVRAIRRVARPIVTFLASAEELQKRLFLKKKLVLRTDWCVTLDRVDRALYPEIATNPAQLRRWKELFGWAPEGDTVTVAHLEQNLGLLVETRLFDAGFTARLLASLQGNLDATTSGVLVRGENLQALRLLERRYRGQVHCQYIDPPYNTGSDGFAYKDNYRHSSWLCLMDDRLRASRGFARPDATSLVSIDDNEAHHLLALQQAIYGEDALLGVLTWEKRTKAQNTASARQMLQSKVEYVQAFRDPALPQRFRLEATARKVYPHTDATGPYRLQDVGQMAADGIRGRQTMVFPIHGIAPRPGMQWKLGQEEVRRLDAAGRIRIVDGAPVVLLRPDDEDPSRYAPFWSHFLDKDAYGTAESGLAELRNDLGLGRSIETVKPTRLLRKLLFHFTPKDGLVLDFFGGSGTTAHAVIALNREDEGRRRFLLVEMNDHFDAVLLPRVLKATYAAEWKDGEPLDRAGVAGGALYKVLTLESYEDALANVTLPPAAPVPFEGALHRAYVVRYLFDRETHGARLDLDRFRAPFACTMEVRRGGLIKPHHPVDLVESFACLLGLEVERTGFIGAPDRARWQVGTVRDAGGARRVFVLWRDCTAVPDDALAAVLDDPALAAATAPPPHLVYINGDPPPSALARPGWSLLAIEDTFSRLAFAADLEA